MKETLEILIVEDNPKHLVDAQQITGLYRDINFTYVTHLAEAEGRLAEKKYDAVVTDALFPKDEHSSPTAASVDLIQKLYNLGIPFVINTAGNHHGKAYEPVLKAVYEIFRAMRNDTGHFAGLSETLLATGKIIEAYPEDKEGEKDAKQWEAAINYTLLLIESSKVDETVKRRVGDWFPVHCTGDRGQLTSMFNLVLNNSLGIEELGFYELDHDGPKMNPHPAWHYKAKSVGRSEGWIHWVRSPITGEYEKEEKIEDQQKLLATEARIKEEFRVGLEFIRATIAHYKQM